MSRIDTDDVKKQNRIFRVRQLSVIIRVIRGKEVYLFYSTNLLNSARRLPKFTKSPTRIPVAFK